MTHYFRQIFEPQLFSEIMAEDQSVGLNVDDLRKMIDDARDLGSDYMPMFSTGAIVADPIVGGFNNDIITLVTADCVSACDMMTGLLKSSQRALILGTHSNGTGAGYTSTETLNTQWEDRLKVISTQIPNFLFGFADENPATTIFEEDSVLRLCSENKPTYADLEYKTSMFDITNNSLGWLQASAFLFNQIDAMRAAETAQIKKEKEGKTVLPVPPKVVETK